MFDDHSDTYFILGLLSFLLAHVFYCIVFLKNRNPHRNAFGLSLILLIYFAVLAVFLGKAPYLKPGGVMLAAGANLALMLVYYLFA